MAIPGIEMNTGRSIPAISFGTGKDITDRVCRCLQRGVS